MTFLKWMHQIVSYQPSELVLNRIMTLHQFQGLLSCYKFFAKKMYVREVWLGGTDSYQLSPLKKVVKFLL